jgi:hypothetical protein
MNKRVMIEREKEKGMSPMNTKNTNFQTFVILNSKKATRFMEWL